MRNFVPATLAIAQDIDKEDHFCIIIEKYCVSVKIKPKRKMKYEMDYVTEKLM